jgi:predicted patatin/cPLA2 family phospholipase
MLSWILKEEETDTCWYCEWRDDAEHTLFKCNRWEKPRWALEMKTAVRHTAENFVRTMLTSKENWNASVQFVTAVLKQNKIDERRRETEARRQT